jgi:WD40 repeat protein
VEVKVWDVPTGQDTYTLKGHMGAVSSVVFSRDGKRLAMTVRVWDAHTGRQYAKLAGQFCDIRALAIASARHEKAANFPSDRLRTTENTALRIGSNFDVSLCSVLAKVAFCHRELVEKQAILAFSKVAH